MSDTDNNPLTVHKLNKLSREHGFKTSEDVESFMRDHVVDGVVSSAPYEVRVAIETNLRLQYLKGADPATASPKDRDYIETMVRLMRAGK